MANVYAKSDRPSVPDDTPVDGVVDEAISSNWAYDHENDADVHHTQNTDTDLDATFKATLAKSGANSDITALSGLTTALTVAQGGSGAKTFTDTAVLTGNVAGAFNASTLKVSDAGEATNASQPAFNAHVTATQSNVTGDGTAYDIIGAIWTEVFDQGNDFSNGTFTAPVTGRYLLCGTIGLDGVLVDHTYGYGSVVTSNRTYPAFSANPGAIAGATSLYMPFSFIADMDVNDTAYLNVRIYYGAKVIDVKAGTYFMGSLIC